MKEFLSLLIALAALTACSGGEDLPGGSQQAGRIDASYAVAGALTCGSDVKRAPTLPLDVEPVAMLVCADPASMVPWTAPVDVVQQDLSRLVDAMTDLEPAPDEPFDCTFDGGVAFDLVLRLPDDRAVRVHGDTGGCSLVEAGDGDRLGSDEFFRTVLELVEAQRSSTSPPAVLPAPLREAPPTCPEDPQEWPPYSLVGEATDLVVAISCWRPDAKELRPFGPGATLPRSDLRLLLDDMRQNSARSKDVGAGHDCPGGLDNLYTQTLIGRTAWGDLVEVQGWCHEFFLRPPWTQEGGDPLLWHPSPVAQRTLDDLRR